jgi:hypothetical protein
MSNDTNDWRARRAGLVGATGLTIALWSPAALVAGAGPAAFVSLLLCGVGPLMWTVGECLAIRRLEHSLAA